VYYMFCNSRGCKHCDRCGCRGHPRSWPFAQAILVSLVLGSIANFHSEHQPIFFYELGIAKLRHTDRYTEYDNRKLPDSDVPSRLWTVPPSVTDSCFRAACFFSVACLPFAVDGFLASSLERLTNLVVFKHCLVFLSVGSEVLFE